VISGVETERSRGTILGAMLHLLGGRECLLKQEQPMKENENNQGKQTTV
jgi:hypothetical protein